MLKKSMRLCFTSISNNLIVNCQKRLSSTNSNAKRKYDLFSAVCLERHPIITRPLNDLENRYIKHLEDMTFRNSLKNDFEITEEMEIKEAELIQKGLKEINLDVAATKSTRDIKDAGVKVLKEFPFAPRITEADEKQILTSLDRKLDRNLLLLVEQNIGNNMYWIPPQRLRVEGETMRDTAERALKEVCGENLKVKFYGHAPIGHYKYSYPKILQEKLNSHGAKVFYYLARYINGTVPDKLKHQWLDRSEMLNILPSKVHKRLSMFLIP